jgi:hypothetical protein
VLRRAAQSHFVDPSSPWPPSAAAAIRIAFSGISTFFGFLFETLVARDLRVYAQASDARILQCRDSDGLEVDAIVEAADGRRMALELELG